jgi:hypothetical protein
MVERQIAFRKTAGEAFRNVTVRRIFEELLKSKKALKASFGFVKT